MNKHRYEWGLPWIIVQQHALALPRLASPGLDPTGRGPHTENAQGGCLSRQQYRSITRHLVYHLSSFIPRIFKGRLKAAVCEGGISSKKRAAAPTGAHGGTSRPVRLIKNIHYYPWKECAYYCGRENRTDEHLFIYFFDRLRCHFLHASTRAHRPPVVPPVVALHVKALTCSRGERGNGKWKGKTSQPCPPSSSTNDSERLQQITDGSAVHSQSQGRGQSHPWAEGCLSPRPHRCPLAASLQSDEPAQHHQICSQTSTRAG